MNSMGRNGMLWNFNKMLYKYYNILILINLLTYNYINSFLKECSLIHEIGPLRLLYGFCIGPFIMEGFQQVTF